MGYAVIELEKDKINWDIVEIYKNNDDLLAVIDEWVLNPDYRLLPKLYKVKDLVNKIQPEKNKNIDIYRGFSINGNMQNFFSLKPSEVFNNPDKEFIVTINTPLSFTIERAIAEDFGDCVVHSKINSEIKNFLRLTDELAAAICLRRNISLETQREWVFLPVSPTKLKINFIKYTKPKWWKFW